MTQSNPLSPEEKGTPTQDENIRRAVLVGQNIGANQALFLLLGIYLALSTGGAWQGYLVILVALEAVIGGFVGANLIQRGQHIRGAWVLHITTWLAPAIASFAIAQLGFVAFAFILTTSIFIINWAFPAKSRRAGIIITGLVLVIPILAELIAPSWRLVSPLFLTIAPIITTILAIVSIVIVARQAWVTSMRNKLLVAIIGVILVATAALIVYTYISTSNILQQGLEGELAQHTDGVVEGVSNLLEEQINILTTLGANEILQQAVIQENNIYPSSATEIQAILDAKDAQWRAADAADNNRDPLVREHLTSTVAQELVEFQNIFPDNAEVFITDVYGGLTGATNRTSDYYQADELWWQVAYNNGAGAVFIGNPEFDESANVLAVQIALPLRDRDTGEVVGILRTTYQASALEGILAEQVGETGETDMYFPGEIVFHIHEGQYSQVDPKEFEELQTIANQGLVEIDYEGIPSVVLQETLQSPGNNPAINNLGWVIVFHQNQDEAFAPINAQTRGLVTVAVVVIVLSVLAALGLSIVLVRPITSLTRSAEIFASGDLAARTDVSTSDEIGQLATTFNNMASQLQDTLEGLEQRVAARTKDLATVAEVGTAVSTILEINRLLQEVVDLTRERFNLYYAHIFLLDEAGENLVVAAGAGEAGRKLKAQGLTIPVDREQSLVARAARERKGVTVNDVTLAPDFLANPLLPDTRSELAVPMISGNTLIGVFDIQSDQVGRFTESDVSIQTTLSAQIATAVQNARTYEQTQKQAELETKVNLINQRIQRAGSIEETLQVAIRELGIAVGAARVKASLRPIAEGVTVTSSTPSPLVAKAESDENTNDAAPAEQE